MGNKPNWGAALQTWGAGLSNYAEQKRLEEEAKRLRQQQLDDEARKRDQYLNDFYALHGQPISQGYMGQDATGVMPMDPVAALGQQPLPDYAPFPRVDSGASMDNVLGVDIPQFKSSAIPVPAASLGLKLPEQMTGPAVPNIQQQLDPNVILGGKSVPYAPWMQGMAPDAASEIYTRMNPVPKQTTADVPDYYMQTPDGQYTGFSGAPWSAAGEGRRMNVTGTYNNRPVMSYENWTPPRDPGAGTKPKDPREIALEMFGGKKSSGDYDPKTQTATPYSYRLPGSLWNPVTAPLDITDELVVATQQAADAGYKIDTALDATKVLEFVLGQYDMDKANQMARDFAQDTEGWVPETRKVGGKVVEIPGKFKLPLRGKKDPKMDAIMFYTDVINRQLADGADEVEWNTIKAWLKKNDMTFEEVQPYIKLGQALAPAPEGF